jgi:hypothetical protein
MTTSVSSAVAAVWVGVELELDRGLPDDERHERMIVFEKFPVKIRLIRRGPGWSFALVGRDKPWWIKARAIRGVRWVTKSRCDWLYWDKP